MLRIHRFVAEFGGRFLTADEAESVTRENDLRAVREHHDEIDVEHDIFRVRGREIDLQRGPRGDLDNDSRAGRWTMDGGDLMHGARPVLGRARARGRFGGGGLGLAVRHLDR